MESNKVFVTYFLSIEYLCKKNAYYFVQCLGSCHFVDSEVLKVNITPTFVYNDFLSDIA